MPTGRIVIIPFLRGKVTADGSLMEPDIDAIFEQWLQRHPEFRAEIPAFVAEIKTIFEPWQLRECLEKARQTEPFDPSLFEPMSSPLLGEEEVEFDAEEVEEMRKDDIRQCARDLLLIERAREWLLEDGQ